MKERIYSFDLIRAVCCWIIVICHFGFSCLMSPTFADANKLVYHANGDWGEITAVAVFFMISGASLYYNHREIHFADLKKFYYTRFKGIFPMFYLLWLFLFFQKAVAAHNLFYIGNKKSLILTLFGMDGYLKYRFTYNYYIIGEWFLGALIFLYILYPLLTWGMKKCRWIVTAVLGLAFAAILYRYTFMIPITRNLITCLVSMWLGMLFIEYREFFSKTVFAVVFGIITLLLIFVSVPIPNTLSMIIMAMGILLVLNRTADTIMKPAPVKSFISLTSSLSYPIFLLQHIVIDQVLSIYEGQTLGHFEEFLLLIMTFVVTYIFAIVLNLVNKAFVKTALFKKLDSLFITN
ncbi:MAG: acyltransferase family protein [Lachnospiraceae bacterium]|nr:acyltransferase family protein [Lachnospiraceae bacterium]